MRLKITLIFIIMIYSITNISFIFAADSSVKLEAENAGGNYVVVEAVDASGGKYIGIDHTLDANEKPNYSMVYENLSKTTSIKMTYATHGQGDIVIYVEENGENIEVGRIPFISSSSWEPFGGQELIAVADGLDIKEGSKVIMVTTNPVNIDCFEFIYSEPPKTEDPKTEDPKTENPETENPETENPETENPKTDDYKSPIVLSVVGILISYLVISKRKLLTNV